MSKLFSNLAYIWAAQRWAAWRKSFGALTGCKLLYGTRKMFSSARIKQYRLDWISENGPCAYCGSALNLEVDHVDPKTKVLTAQQIWHLSPSNPAAISELAKCQVLCHSCHKVKSGSELRGRRRAAAPLAHGSSRAYKSGCRCEPCRAFKRIANARFRSRGG